MEKARSAARISFAFVTYREEGKVVVPTSNQLLAEALCQAAEQEERASRQVLHVDWADPAVPWADFAAVVVRSCWDYHLRETEFAAWLQRLEQEATVVHNAVGLMQWNRNKAYLRELAARGVAIPPTVWLKAGESCDIADVCKAQGWPAAVVKPLVSAGAHQTELLRKGSVGGTDGEWMVQRYEEAIATAGEWSLIYLGGQYSHAVRKLPKAGDFRVQTQFGGSTVPAEPSDAMRAFAEQALAALPEPALFARVDLVQGQELLLMELEVIEPELFLNEASAVRAARALLAATPETVPARA